MAKVSVCMEIFGITPEELRELLAEIVNEYKGRWVEFGVIERDFALKWPDGFRRLVAAKGHLSDPASTHPKSSSEYLGKRLSEAARQGLIAHVRHEGTGQWKRPDIGWYSALPAPEWSPDVNTYSYADSRIKWADYVPEPTAKP